MIVGGTQLRIIRLYVVVLYVDVQKKSVKLELQPTEPQLTYFLRRARTVEGLPAVLS